MFRENMFYCPHFELFKSHFFCNPLSLPFTLLLKNSLARFYSINCLSRVGRICESFSLCDLLASQNLLLSNNKYFSEWDLKLRKRVLGKKWDSNFILTFAIAKVRCNSMMAMKGFVNNLMQQCIINNISKNKH